MGFERFSGALEEMRVILRDKMLPFWLDRSIDDSFGGYLTSFDETGLPYGDGTKYLVTQCRMIWGFSALLPFASPSDQNRMRHAARQGVRFLLDRFWDEGSGGFFWRLNRDGSLGDPAKLVYGESFAIYALSEFSLRFSDPEALRFAERTFDLLQIYAADTLNGGYFENLERDFSRSPGGSFAGDRKSLDIHMHLMEAFTTLCLASGKEIHARKLREVLRLIFEKMVDAGHGFGYNQFDERFRKIPAIDIARTWNAEREKGESIEAPTDTTSYGHNVELSWLADAALCALGEQGAPYDQVFRALLDHSLRCGYDHQEGGVYRDGVGENPALITDKEWWQNFEAMVGYANGFLRFGESRYADAFSKTWAFTREHFLHPDLGESYQLLDRRGNVLVGNLGNPWKGVYHTGRALAECIKRLEALKKNRGSEE